MLAVRWLPVAAIGDGWGVRPPRLFAATSEYDMITMSSLVHAVFSLARMGGDHDSRKTPDFPNRLIQPGAYGRDQKPFLLPTAIFQRLDLPDYLLRL